MREVTEEVRRDRMFRMWKKYGPYVISLIVLIIAGTAGWTWWQQQQREAARELGGQFLEAEIASVEAQQQLLERTEGEAAVIARLRLAAAHAEAGNNEEAARVYGEVAAVEGLAPVYTDLARLQAIRLELPTMDPAQAVSELDALTAEGAPYRLLALELRAIAKLNAGDTEGAHADLTTIIQSADATRDSIDRAGALLVASGGEMPSARLMRGES
jgi:hypothetical protein